MLYHISILHYLPVVGGGYKEKVEEGEYGRNISYSCMKMEK
jgi:hypothetical protein